MYIYIYIYVRVRVCVCACACVRACVCICINVCVCVCTHMYIYVCMYVCMYMYIYFIKLKICCNAVLSLMHNKSIRFSSIREKIEFEVFCVFYILRVFNVFRAAFGMQGLTITIRMLRAAKSCFLKLV